MIKINRYYTLFFLMALFIFYTLGLENADALTTSPRISGPDRYLTSIEISKNGWDKAENVVLATGKTFPDALSATPLAHQLNAPILLTKKDELSKELLGELNRLETKNIYIIGGIEAISEDIETKLRAMKFIVDRISGTDRYETSLKIASKINMRTEDGAEIIIATGENFPDALSIAPIAAIKGIPILLTPKDTIRDDAQTFITENSITKAYVIGGLGVISNKVTDLLANDERVWGNNRYETNNAVLEKFSDIIDFDKTYIATGSNFPDALAGSALAAKTLSPIVLISQFDSGSLPDSEYNTKIGKILPIGGEGVLTNAAIQRLTSIIQYGSEQLLGNSPANGFSGGYAAGQGDYIYYYGKEGSKGAIFKMKKDGSEKVKLTDTGDAIGGYPPFINVVGDWIYYRYQAPVVIKPGGYSEYVEYKGSIYKIKTDGTLRTKISDDNGWNIFVIDDSIYYTNRYLSAGDENKPGIYKIKTNGTGKVKLASFENVATAQLNNVADGYIYYHDNTKTYRINLNGGEKTQINDGHIRNYGTKNWVYYSDEMGGIIFKAKPDGSEKTIFYQSMGPDILNIVNLYNGYLYFTTEKGTYKINIDGTGLTKVMDDRAYGVSIIDDYLYYYYYLDVNNGVISQTQRIKIDGTEKMELSLL